MPAKVNKVNQSDGDAVFDVIHALMHLYRAQQQAAVRDTAPGLTHLEGKVLGFFARRPGALAGDLAAHSGRDKAQVARLLAGLKDRGLIESRADAVDRRRQTIHLTPTGQALHAAQQREVRHVARRSLDGLTDAERKRLLELLQRLRSNLEASDNAG